MILIDRRGEEHHAVQMAGAFLFRAGGCIERFQAGCWLVLHQTSREIGAGRRFVVPASQVGPVGCPFHVALEGSQDER